MDNNKVNVVNGSVVGVFLGKPMQDATPDKVEDNDAYYTERNTVSRVPNSVENWEEQPEPSAGGVSSWNDLTDKPFWKEVKTTKVNALNISWDGDTDGRTVILFESFEEEGISGTSGFYKVSDAVLSDAEIISARISINMNGNVTDFLVADFFAGMESNGVDISELISGPIVEIGNYCIVVKKPDEYFSECGVYFCKYTVTENENTVNFGLSTSLIIEDGEYVETIVHKIDNDYLPEFADVAFSGVPQMYKEVSVDAHTNKTYFINTLTEAFEYRVPIVIYYTDAQGNQYKLLCENWNMPIESKVYWQIDHPVMFSMNNMRCNVLMDRLYVKFDDNGNVVIGDSFLRYPWETYLATNSMGSKVFKITVSNNGTLTATEVTI